MFELEDQRCRKSVAPDTEVLVFHMLYQERNMFCACCIREKLSFAVTTRERKPFEEDGKEYHFLTREEMEEEIISQR